MLLHAADHTVCESVRERAEEDRDGRQGGGQENTETDRKEEGNQLFA